MAIDRPGSFEDDPYRFLFGCDKYDTGLPMPEPRAKSLPYFIGSNDTDTTISSTATLISIDAVNGIDAAAAYTSGAARIPGLPDIDGSPRLSNSASINAHVRCARRLATNGLAHSDAAITDTLENHNRRQDSLTRLYQTVNSTYHDVSAMFYRLVEMERVFAEVLKHLDEIANLQRASHAQIEACTRCLF
jgi:hypothetical protein